MKNLFPKMHIFLSSEFLVLKLFTFGQSKLKNKLAQLQYYLQTKKKLVIGK